MLHVQSVFFFLLIRSIVVRFRCLHLVFTITQSYIFFEETTNIKERLALIPGKIYILRFWETAHLPPPLTQHFALSGK